VRNRPCNDKGGGRLRGYGRTQGAKLEALLSQATGSGRSKLMLEPAAFARLQFFARMLRHDPCSAERSARLLWLNERGDVACAALTGAPVVIGRDPACDVVLASSHLSRRHCVVRWREAHGPAIALEIEDLSSSNGTLVNGTPMEPRISRRLRDGDVIELGGIALAVLVPPQAE